MSTSAILPIQSIDFGASSATAPQQTVFNNLLAQLQQSIGSGDLTTSDTLFNAIEALSPSAANGSNALGTFLTSLGSALNSGNVSQAQSALSTYQSNTPATTSSTTTPSTTTPASDTSVTTAQIAASLVESQNQLSLVTMLLGPDSSLGDNSSSNSSNNSTNSLIAILNAAYPPSGSSSSSSANSASRSTDASDTSTPYDALVSSIQASLAGGDGTLTPALAYLQASGNFVNTSA